MQRTRRWEVQVHSRSAPGLVEPDQVANVDVGHNPPNVIEVVVVTA